MGGAAGKVTPRSRSALHEQALKAERAEERHRKAEEEEEEEDELAAIRRRMMMTRIAEVQVVSIKSVKWKDLPLRIRDKSIIILYVGDNDSTEFDEFWKLAVKNNLSKKRIEIFRCEYSDRVGVDEQFRGPLRMFGAHGAAIFYSCDDGVRGCMGMRTWTKDAIMNWTDTMVDKTFEEPNEFCGHKGCYRMYDHEHKGFPLQWDDVEFDDDFDDDVDYDYCRAAT